MCPGRGADIGCPDPARVGVGTGCVAVRVSPTSATSAHRAPCRERPTLHTFTKTQTCRHHPETEVRRGGGEQYLR